MKGVVTVQDLSNRNFQVELEKLIEKQTSKPKLMLHACCAPCSSYVLEFLSRHFEILMTYYNPNITPEAEYSKRLTELERLLSGAPFAKNVTLIPCEYNPSLFFDMAKGMENLPEGGDRCTKCYKLRLEQAAKLAKEHNCDFFTTTLSISPYKNSQKLAMVSLELEQEYGVKWLPSDFKKRGGYKRSIELSKEYNLYRQNYCGCVYSKIQSENRKR